MASAPSKASVWARVQVAGVERVVEVTEDAMTTPVPFFVAIARELGADAEELRLTYLDDEGDWYAATTRGTSLPGARYVHVLLCVCGSYLYSSGRPGTAAVARAYKWLTVAVAPRPLRMCSAGAA